MTKAIQWKTIWFISLTLGSASSPKMVDGCKDEPEGLLFITTDPQNLHGCLQLGKQLGGSLLLLSLGDIAYSTFKFLYELLIKNLKGYKNQIN